MSRITLIAIVLLLLLAGCRGGKSTVSDAPDASETVSSGPIALNLEAQEQNGAWRVTLSATGSDMYQAAGTLMCGEGGYDVLSIEAGGGLGGPQECYFAGKETEPGRIDFAYTRRYCGTGVDGNAALISLVVQPHGKFKLADFALATQPQLLIRDSSKQPIEIDQEVR